MAVTTTDIFLGHGTVVGVGIESTWGSAQAPSVMFPVVSCDVQDLYQQAERPHLVQSGARTPTGYAPSASDVQVVIEMELAYDVIGALLRSAMGPAPSTTGAGPYVHPQLLGMQLPSLTIDRYRGRETGSLTARYERVVGCVCDEMVLSIRAGEVPRARFTYFGKSLTRADQGSPTIVTPTNVFAHQAGTIGWNSGTYDGNSVEITVSNGMARRRNLGSLATARPHPSALQQIRLRLVRDHVDEDFLSALSAETESDLTLSFTGSGNNAMVVTMHLARVLTPIQLAVSEGGFGAIPETIEFAPRWDPSGTDYGLIIQTTNDNASYLT